MLWQFYCGVFLKSSMWRPMSCHVVSQGPGSHPDCSCYHLRCCSCYVCEPETSAQTEETDRREGAASMDAGGANGCLTYLTFNWRAMQSGFLDLLDMLDSSCKMLQDVPRSFTFSVEPLHTASGFKAIDMFQDVLVIVACCWMLLQWRFRQVQVGLRKLTLPCLFFSCRALTPGN